MTRYLLSVHSAPAAAREPMTDAEMQHSWQQIQALEAQMRAAGALVMSARLTGPDSASVVRVSKGRAMATDGPFVEAKEHLGGFYLIEAPDLDAAIGWASKTSEIIQEPIEVRALAGFVEG